MKVIILIFCLRDLYDVNIKQEKFGMIEIVPHWKIGPDYYVVGWTQLWRIYFLI